MAEPRSLEDLNDDELRALASRNSIDPDQSRDDLIAELADEGVEAPDQPDEDDEANLGAPLTSGSDAPSGQRGERFSRSGTTGLDDVDPTTRLYTDPRPAGPANPAANYTSHEQDAPEEGADSGE